MVVGLHPITVLGCDKISSWGWLDCNKILSWGWLVCNKILSWSWLGCDKIFSWSWLGCDKILSWGWLGYDKISSWGWFGCNKILSWSWLGFDKILSSGWLGFDKILILPFWSYDSVSVLGSHRWTIFSISDMLNLYFFFFLCICRYLGIRNLEYFYKRSNFAFSLTKSSDLHYKSLWDKFLHVFVSIQISKLFTFLKYAFR